MVCGSMEEGRERSIRYRVEEYRTLMRQDMGAYSDSRGYGFIRDNVNAYLNTRDDTTQLQPEIYLQESVQEAFHSLTHWALLPGDTLLVPLHGAHSLKALGTLRGIRL